MVAPPKALRITLGAAVDRYLDAVAAQVTVGNLSPATRDNYAADLADFTGIVGADVVVDDISGQDVDTAIARFGSLPDRRFVDPARKRAPGISVATQRRFRQSVSKFFSHAAQNGWVQLSPMQWSVLNPTVRGGLRTARTALTGDQALALLEYGPGEPESSAVRPHERNWARDRFVLSVLAVLGPRVSELCGADLEDMWTEDGQVIWRIEGKGGKVRKVPLSPWLAERRDAYLAVRPAPGPQLSPEQRADASRALVRTGRGARLDPRDVQRLLRRAEQRVQLVAPERAREVTPHALRHTAATIMLSAGWDVKLVAQMLGHSSIATTGQYLDELPGELAAAVAANPLSVS
ncbi:tyrosine-type recombinase/integrase [Raineyella sp. LH-20]|uniref:tyrosine-type recombinase/integrase n=1 Tax=Raineyella sp. LH-20 TaxID=3081204 RepID=UPI002954619C|nr:tyrosine-type recombinase/integrase [Raineyella sp. LH-20]WOP18137.1 tyrosine-type recombinase/integrase [Raineyella sp. LH-20]